MTIFVTILLTNRMTIRVTILVTILVTLGGGPIVPKLACLEAGLSS